MWLVAAVALPLALLGATSLWNQYRTDRVRAEAQLVAQARTMAQLVDREFERAIMVADTLAASTVLASGDLNAFERELRAAHDLLSAGLPAGTPPAMLRLVGADGIRRLDTSWAPGERRPDAVRVLPHLAAVLASGRPEISDLFIAQQFNRPFVAVTAPVLSPKQEGHSSAVAAIGISVPRERFAAIVAAAGLPAGGFASVHDRRGMTVVRSLRDAEAVGQPPAPAVLAAILGAEAGMAPRGTGSLEGVPSAIAFAHAPLSGFIVKLNVPEAVFLGPLKATLLRSAAIGALVLAGGLLIAFMFAGRVVRAFRKVPRMALDGAVRGGALGMTGLREADELAVALAATFAERRRAEQALQESEARFRILADAMPQMVWSATPEGKLDYFNARWNAFTGPPAAVGPDDAWLTLIHPEDQGRLMERWQHSLRTGEPYEVETRLRRHDGTYCWTLARALPARDEAGRILRWFGSSTEIQEIVEARDVLKRGRTDLERLIEERTRDLEATQARLAQAQRMEALGQLAGGIAHDFNNVLQSVHGGAALIERRAGDAEGVRRLGRMITEAAERGATITRRLLTFSRRSALRAEPVDAATLLANMREILAHTLGGGVEVRVNAPAGLAPLLADKSQLETVLVNLAANARDAMSGTGLLTLGATAETLPEEECRRHPAGLRAGSYLCLSVSDTGAGMDAATLARASEPFFTTKATGKGTGLGLSMSKGFAEQSGGGLSIESSPGRGTEVRLWFPVAGEAPPAALREAVPASPAAQDQRARLLVVDDEAIVREIVAEQLEAAGYAVSIAASAAAALDLLDQGKPVDLLVSDLSMPGMDGLMLIREAQRRRPGLPAILLTGFVTNAAEIAIGGALSGGFSLLNKPVDGRRLADRVAVLLEGARLEG
ncbi:MAG TPA: response regulator [Roseomonas sp.]|jgi:PAS domain S-box-containing protein